MKILILCTGNSCRSQMAEGFLKAMKQDAEIYSAGTHPAKEVHPMAVKVMAEEGIDIGGNYPKNVDMFINKSFDFVITVCDSAKESCPVFSGDVKHRIHIGFDDPADAVGTQEEILSEFRRIRDEIKKSFTEFKKNFLSDKNGKGVS